MVIILCFVVKGAGFTSLFFAYNLRVMYNKNIYFTEKFKSCLVVLLLFFLTTFNIALADDYSEGLTAFVGGDYAKAQQFWISAATVGDARSMFNLGFLNERSKLVTSSNDKAQEWYLKSANAGYSAAYYYLGRYLLKNGDSNDQAVAFIVQAVEQGYAPAIRYMGSSSEPSKRIGNDVLKQSKKANEFQVESWINEQKAGGWTIQLLAFSQESSVKAFIIKHQLAGKAAYFIEKKDGGLLYKLIYGVFNTKDEAVSARQNLSVELQEHGPWLRTIASVQAITKG